MNKLNQAVLVVGVMCGVSMAAYSDTLAANASGAYILAGLGLQAFNQHISYSTQGFAGGQAQGSYSGSIKTRHTPMYGHFGAGYGFAVDDNSYVAAEAVYDFLSKDSVSGSASNDLGGGKGIVDYSYRASNQIELNAIIGHTLFTNSLGYLKLGYVGTWLNTNVGYRVVVGGVPTADLYKASLDQYRQGALFGIGMRLPVSSRLQLAAEYNYLYYANKNYAFNAGPTAAAPNQDSYQHFNFHDVLSSNNFLVSLLIRL